MFENYGRVKQLKQALLSDDGMIWGVGFKEKDSDAYLDSAINSIVISCSTP